MKFNQTDLVKFQSYLYIINRDEYENINYENIRRVTTNKLVLRWLGGKELWGYLHTDHTVHIIKWDIVPFNKNWKSYTLQKISYLDTKTWEKKEWYVADKYLDEMSWDDLKWLNGYLIENQIDTSFENKKSLYEDVKDEFNNIEYDSSIIEHNQSIYIHQVEIKITKELTQKNTKKMIEFHKNEIYNQTQGNITTPIYTNETLNNWGEENIVIPIHPTNTQNNFIENIIEDSNIYDIQVQNTLQWIRWEIDRIFANTVDSVRKVEYQQWIELWTREQVIQQLNNKLSKLVAWRNPEMFNTSKLGIKEDDTSELIIQKCIDFIFSTQMWTNYTLSQQIDNSELEYIKKYYNNDNEKFLKRIYWNNKTGGTEYSKHKAFLIRWLLEK
jgi:hypothetical protein